VRKTVYLLLAAFLLLASCGRTQSQQSPSPPSLSPSPFLSPSPSPALPSPSPEPDHPVYSLTILHTNDWHGVLDDVPKYAALIREIRDDMDNVLLLDGGDIFRRGPFEEYLGEAEIVVMNALGYDALVLGNNDFPRRGELPDISFHPILRSAGFPILCANVTIGGEFLPGVEPYIILDAGGLDIAIIGVTSMKPFNRNEYASEWADFVSPEEAVAQLLDEVSELSDIQLVLSHAGYEKDLLMRGVSAVIGGDDHRTLFRPLTVRDGENIFPIVQAGGEEEHYLGRLDLDFAEIGGVWVLTGFSGSLLSLDGVVPDMDMLLLIESLYDYLPALAG
jgi:5'-nucleotidase